MNLFFIALSSIALSVMAQFALKAGMSSSDIKEAMIQPFGLQTIFKLITNKLLLGGFFLYGLGAVIWLIVLSKWDVSKAYPLVGLGFVLSIFIGFLVGEQITSFRIFGAVLICFGVLLISRT